MVGAIIGVIVLLAICGGMVYAVMYQIKKTDPKNVDTTLKKNIETTQEFLPFTDIKDSMIDLGGHNYRAIIECSSVNYHLKTDKEKEIIELTFQRFLNSLTFPITFFVQTKTMDNTKMLENLRKDLTNTLEQYENLDEYANVYFQEIADLYNNIGNNKMKKKYIIVPYNEGISLGNLTDEEKYEYSIKEMYTRCQILIDGINSMGIRGKILNTAEITELLISTNYKDNYAQVDQVVSGEYLEMIVEGEKNRLSEITPDARLDWILYEAQLRLQTELLDDKISTDVQDSTSKAIKEINQIREALAGYYQSKEIKVVSSFKQSNRTKE